MVLKEAELAVYQERKLVAMPAAELDTVRSGEVVESPDVYLGTDVFQGEYGVTSFGLVVPRPKQRPVVYYPEEGPTWGIGDGSSDIDDQIYRDDIHKAHHVKTRQGFAVVRAVLAPKEIQDGFREDRFLGPAIIDKCCIEGTVSGLDEEDSLASNTSDGLHDFDASPSLAVDLESYRPVIQRLKDRLQETNGAEFVVLREYPSWHSYRVYKEVLDEITRGCQGTIVNFDEVLSRLAGDSITRLHDFEKQSVAAGKVALLPSQT